MTKPLRFLKPQRFSAIFLIILSCFSFTTSYAQSIDLSDIYTLEEYEAFKNRKDVVEALGYFSYLENVTWNGIALEHAVIKDSEIFMKLPYAAKNNTINCINLLKSTYGNQLKIRNSWVSSYFSFENKNYKLKLSVNSTEENIDEKSGGELTISFKKQYAIPLAQISNVFDENPQTGSLYYVDINHHNTSYELLLNGIPIEKYTSRHRYLEENSILLNPFIIDGKPQNLSIKITAGEDENGKIPDTIAKDAYFKAVLSEKAAFSKEEISQQELCNYAEYVTDTIVEDGNTRYYSYLGTYHYGKKTLSCDYQFVPAINYAVTAWKNGQDLRKDKELKNNIKALYQELADAFKTHNEQKINDLLFQTYKETVMSSYNSEGRTEALWEKLLPFIHYAYKFNVADDFELVFSEDGKLVYAEPKDQSDMLRVIGKKIATGFNFYIYKDASTKQLKFIREK